MAALQCREVVRWEGGCYHAERVSADEGVEGWEVPYGVIGSKMHSIPLRT